MDFTFLTEEQIFEQIFDNKQLEILRDFGIECSITDFSVLLGGYISNKYTGHWWTKTSRKTDVNIVDANGMNRWNYPDKRTKGARPAVDYSSISSIARNKVRNEKGILEVECGEYPQTLVPKDVSKKLEDAYQLGTLKETGKSYTTDSVEYYETEQPFKERKHIEYEYNGKKYIRFAANPNDMISSSLVFENFTEKGKPYWIEVEPIKWLIDEKTGIALSKKILFAGVQFTKGSYDGNFENTDIKHFMDTYFSKEILANIFNEMTPEELAEFEQEQKRIEQRRNPYSFNFETVSEEDIIRGSIESGLSVFLHGRSSEGKSARVKQIDPDCTIIYLRTATPESLNGKSVYDSTTGQMVDVKPTWLTKLEEKCASEPDKIHILFFDEITNALPSIQGMAFNIVLDKEVNGKWKLPENARIVAAGNDMKDSLAANQLAEPLFNRFVHVYIETTVETWLRWASENNIHPAIYAYVAYKREGVLRSNYNGETPNADPRKWEMASKMLYATKNPEMLRGLLGEDITRDFVEFCRQRVITLEEVIKGTYNTRDIENLNTAERYATVMGLSQVDEENLEVVRDFVINLGSEFCAIFDTLWINGDETRLEIIAELKIKNGGKIV